MQQKKNPVLIVIAVCGGCVLIGIIIFAVLAGTLYKKGSGLVGGIVNMTMNMPRFLADVQNKNYIGAESLVDPAAQGKLSADKIQHMEEAVEKKLGPLKSFPQQPSGQNQTTNANATPGQMPSMQMSYTYTLTYAKGTATATFQFDMPDPMKATGKISSFTLEPDTIKKSE